TVSMKESRYETEAVRTKKNGSIITNKHKIDCCPSLVQMKCLPPEAMTSWLSLKKKYLIFSRKKVDPRPKVSISHAESNTTKPKTAIQDQRKHIQITEKNAATFGSNDNQRRSHCPLETLIL